MTILYLGQLATEDDPSVESVSYNSGVYSSLNKAMQAMLDFVTSLMEASDNDPPKHLDWTVTRHDHGVPVEWSAHADEDYYLMIRCVKLDDPME